MKTAAQIRREASDAQILAAMFPGMSKSTRDANAAPALASAPPAAPNSYDNQTDRAGEAAKLERNSWDGPLAKSEAEKGNPERVLVRVTSVRKRLIDEDNLAEKYHIDCCRYAGLIHGDSPDQTKIEVCQRKAEKGEAEHTIIEITTP
jgi:hypothetical protein